jgi:glutamine amidotransferase
MCELFALSALRPTNVRLSLEELTRHGGETGPHRDGWGVGFMQDRDALVVRGPEAASDSAHLAFLRSQEVPSSTVVAHIRKATQGPRLLRNTQPFARELGGRMHLFAHNGMLPGVESARGLSARRFRPVGDTDSEHAFCALLERLAPLWEEGATPTLAARLAVVEGFAAELRLLGPANFIYADGDAIFVHGHRRRDETGRIRPPGLHVLCRRCSERSETGPVPGVSMAADHAQEVALVASVPLTSESWEALAEGEVLVLREGRVVLRTSDSNHASGRRAL